MAGKKREKTGNRDNESGSRTRRQIGRVAMKKIRLCRLAIVNAFPVRPCYRELRLRLFIDLIDSAIA